MMEIDPAEALRDALDVLSRAEIERARAVGEATKALGNGNLAMKAEMAAHVLASVIHEIGRTTKRPDDLADVAAAVEGLAVYVSGRMVVIVSELGGEQSRSAKTRAR